MALLNNHCACTYSLTHPLGCWSLSQRATVYISLPVSLSGMRAFPKQNGLFFTSISLAHSIQVCTQYVHNKYLTGKLNINMLEDGLGAENDCQQKKDFKVKYIFNTVLEILSSTVQQEREIKGYRLEGNKENCLHLQLTRLSMQNIPMGLRKTSRTSK